MAQHDYNIANQSGADFRADLNNALSAIVTVNSGATEPSTTFAHQLWVDTANSVLKIRNAADNAWYTTGISITASNTFTGDLTGNVVGNVTGNLVGDVTGDLTGNADTATTLATARTISLSGDVAGSASFDGSGDITISTTAQINSIALGTDTTGDYVESISGGTGVTVTGGTGEGSTPSVAIGQAVATTSDVTFNLVTATNEFVGDICGAVRFTAKAGEALTKGDLVYVSGVSGDVPIVAKAKADDNSKMPVFGLAVANANNNAELQVATFGTLEGLDTSGVSEGQILYASTTAGAYTTTKPTGESTQIQNIGKVIRSHATAGSIKVGGAGRSNDVPNLNDGKIFIGNASNQAVTSTLDTSIVVENTNLYYTTARANTDFDSRLATKDTGDLTEGSNLYYTTARVNSDFDTRLATKDTGDLAEGSNLYYTDARANSAFDTRLATKDTDDVAEGTTNLYYTSARANTDFDTRLATKSTTNLAEGTNLYYTSARFDSAFTSKDTDDLSEGLTNLYYTTARFDSAFGNKTTSDLTEGTNLYYTDTRANSAIDTRVTKAFVDALGIQASSVDANSVTLGTDTVGNYVATVTGTANKITVTGSGSESADVTLTLPDDVQIADSLTVAGNLTVNGTLTSLDTTNLDIEDNLFQLNAGLTGSPVNDSGMLINRGTADNGIFMWDESVDKFTLGLTTADGSATGNITLNSLGTLVANLEGNVTGDITGTVSSLSNHDTGDLAEGTNLYYTQARFDSAFTGKSTSDLSEGTNLYYTDARFDTRLATKDTDDVSEGTTNLYYTTARFDSAFGGKSTTDLSEGTNLYYTSARANSDFDTRLATKSTSDLSEGTNLYYTDARVQAVSINNVVEDTTPQLGGNLDLNSSDITGTGDINITGTVTASDLEIDSGTLSVDSTNNRVGIGTTSPTRTFEVNSGTTNVVARFESTDSRAVAEFKDPSGTAELGNIGNDIYFAPAGAEKMRLTSTGLGIGTTSPDGNLEVVTSTVVSGASDTVNNVLIGLQSANRPTIILDTADTTYTNRTWNITNNGASGHLTIGRNGLDVMTLKNDGKVGIGTSSPAAGIHLTKSSSNNYLRMDDGSNNLINFSADTSSAVMLVQGTGFSSWKPLELRAEYFVFKPEGTERMRIDSSGNVGIGTSSPASKLHIFDGGSSVNNTITFGNPSATPKAEIKHTASGNEFLNISCKGTTSGFGNIAFYTGATPDERMRIDSSGNLLVSKTSSSITNTGTTFESSGRFFTTANGQEAAILNRQTSDGDILQFRKDNTTTVGSIANTGTSPIFRNVNEDGISILTDGGQAKLVSTNSSGLADNDGDIGAASYRWDDIYATNGTIQTSDRNEKQDIEALTDAETRVAVAAKGLLRKFRWKDAVAEKGDEARTHFGIIAQDLQDAFTAEGLDAGDYAMFISSTWTDEETGEEKTRLGVRYSELLAFIIASI